MKIFKELTVKWTFFYRQIYHWYSNNKRDLPWRANYLIRIKYGFLK